MYVIATPAFGRFVMTNSKRQRKDVGNREYKIGKKSEEKK